MNVKIGDRFSTERKVTDELIRKFADVSGDYNPIHLDDQFAAKTQFGRRIAHGMLSGAFISSVLGNEFSEQKIVYLGQTLKFVAPVFIDDVVYVSASVTAIRSDKPVVTLETVCTNQAGQTLVTGQATVMILQ